MISVGDRVEWSKPEYHRTADGRTSTTYGRHSGVITDIDDRTVTIKLDNSPFTIMKGRAFESYVNHGPTTEYLEQRYEVD